MVHWGKKFSHCSSDQDSVTVYFDGDTSVKGSILVGANGSLSSVCNQLVEVHEQFGKITSITPVRVMALDTWISEERQQELKTGTDDRDRTSTNMFWSLNDTEFTRKDGKSFNLLWNLAKHDSDKTIPHSVFQRLALETPDNSQVHQLTICERTATLECLATDKCVFLVGDSAHYMPMYRGEGGNHAMLDSGALGTQLGLCYKNEKTLDEIHQAYYEEMVTRGAKAVADSHDATINFLLYKDIMIGMFKAMQKQMNQ